MHTLTLTYMQSYAPKSPGEEGVGGDKEYKIGDEVVGWNGACLCACQAEIYSSTADFRRKTLTDDTAYACSPKQHTCLIAVKRSRDNTGETTKQARWANRQRDGSLGRAELPAPRSHHSLSARAHETRTSWNGKKNNITACKKSIKHEAERGWKIEGVKNEQIVVKRYQRSLRWLLHTAEMWDVYMKRGDWWCDIHVSACACVWSLTVKKKKNRQQCTPANISGYWKSPEFKERNKHLPSCLLVKVGGCAAAEIYKWYCIWLPDTTSDHN